MVSRKKFTNRPVTGVGATIVCAEQNNECRRRGSHLCLATKEALLCRGASLSSIRGEARFKFGVLRVLTSTEEEDMMASYIASRGRHLATEPLTLHKPVLNRLGTGQRARGPSS